MPVYRLIPIEQCIIDPRYQRPIIENHVERIVNEFDDSMFGVLEASARADDTYAIFDGQQRLEARERRIERELEPPSIKLPALVHSNLTPEQESSLFVELQERRKAITPVEKFKARVFYGDPIAKSMKEIAEKFGYEIGAGPRSIQAVVAAERAFRRGNLDKTLEAIEIWRDEQGSLEASLIDGVSRFFDLFPEAEVKHAQVKWDDTSPKKILRQAGDLLSSSKAGGVLIVVRGLYSDRSHPLPTVEAAVQTRITAQRESGRRYVRVSEEQVRDAVMELREFSFESIREHLGGVSKAGLRRIIKQLLKRGTIKWRFADKKKDEKLGQRYYYYVEPSAQKPKPAPKPRDDENGATATTTRTGGPVKGTGKKPRPTNAEVRKLVEEVRAGNKGVSIQMVASGHWEIKMEGKKRVLVSATPSDSRTVLSDKTRLRRAGYAV